MYIMTICELERDGVAYIAWIKLLLGECAYGVQDAFSVVLGYISILCWLNAQLPQVIENYKSGSASSLSISFLAIWLAGDTSNLIGALLTHQLPFQIYLGVYFVFIDVCLLFQWIYYNQLNSVIKDTYLIIPNSDVQATHLIRQPASHSPVFINTVIVSDELTPFSSSASPSKWYALSSKEDSTTATTKLMAFVLFSTKLLPSSSLSSLDIQDTLSITENNLIFIGRIFAWMCTCFYLLSRIPQILKNHQRQSTDGLSISLFIFATLGNLTYFSSIILRPGHTHSSLLEALPYLIGSAGTLVFDFSIFCQFLASGY
ncbi:hypothetical protein K501DRAFT_248132 [Backusella circina FSU 941]|nr:hypothetical protein K501DRAFT_248132 [Backusella circina FSU 941]